MIKKIKSKLKEIKKKMDERIEYVKEYLDNGNNKISLGLIIMFLGVGLGVGLGGGLIASGVFTNSRARA